MILYIDTSDLHNLKLALIFKDKTRKPVEFALAIDYNEHDKTLGHLAKFLKNNKVSLADLKQIVACSGPGSFTGTRVGVTIAGALGYALEIPVATIKKQQVPKDLRKLTAWRGGKKLNVEYNRPAA